MSDLIAEYESLKALERTVPVLESIAESADYDTRLRAIELLVRVHELLRRST